MKTANTFFRNSLACLLLVCSCLVGHAGTISSYTRTNMGWSGDIVLLDSFSNSVYSTRTITISNLVASPIMSSNRLFINTALVSSNVFTGPGVVTVPTGSHNWVISGGSYTFYPGDFMLVGNDQYAVCESQDGTHYYTFEYAGELKGNQGYTNQPYQIYAVAQKWLDINNNPAGGVHNGGSPFTIGLFSKYHNDGRIFLFNGSNSWSIWEQQNQDGYALEFFSSVSGGPPFAIYDGALFESLDILSNSMVHIGRGLTNKFSSGDTTHGGPIPVYNQWQMTAGAVLGSNVVAWATNAITPGGATVSGNATTAPFTLTGSSGAFATAWPGCQVVFSNQQYTILGISGNNAQIKEPLQANWTNATISIKQGVFSWENTSPQQAGAIGPDGSVDLFGAVSVGNSPSITFSPGGSPSNTLYMQAVGEVDGTDLEVRSGGNGNGGPIFGINSLATTDSLKVLSNSVVKVGTGLTNGAASGNWAYLFGGALSLGNGAITQIVASNATVSATGGFAGLGTGLTNVTGSGYAALNGTNNFSGPSNFMSRFEYTGDPFTAKAEFGAGTNSGATVAYTSIGNNRGYINLTTGSSVTGSTNFLSVTWGRPFVNMPSVHLECVATNGTPSSAYGGITTMNQHRFLVPSTTGLQVLADGSALSVSRTYNFILTVTGN